jgi:phosphate acetyltransferase
MKLIDDIKESARKNPQKIVLADGEDERMIKAALISLKDGIAVPVMLGNEQKIKDLADPLGLDLYGIEIIDPESSPNIVKYSHIYMESRGEKHVTGGMAEKLLKRSLYFAGMMVKAGDVNGMVAGCTSLTASVVKARLKRWYFCAIKFLYHVGTRLYLWGEWKLHLC